MLLTLSVRFTLLFFLAGSKGSSTYYLYCYQSELSCSLLELMTSSLYYSCLPPMKVLLCSDILSVGERALMVLAPLLYC